MQPVRQRVLPIIMLTIFIDVLGIGILIPVIPLLLADPASSFYLLPASFSIDRGYIMLGFLTAMYPFMQFLATPILGQLSDKYGRKYILAGSLFGTALSYVVFAFAIITRNIPLLFISRAFDGLTGGNIAVGQAVLADISKPEERARTFGLIGAVFGIGFILGVFGQVCCVV
jgi:DHA1 family tetracycline resistance protein-like MFS transporter